jgi:DNA-binding CsgD family transcriptional regulator
MLGRLDEANDRLADLGSWVTDDFIGRGELLAAQAELALWGGMPERAVALANAVHEVPAPIHGAYGMPGITRAWAQYEAGVEPEPVSDIAATRIMAGAHAELDGIGLLHAGSPSDAAIRFADAARRWAGFCAARELVCLWAEGEALRQADRPAEMSRSLTAALEAATAQGFEPLAVRIRRSMRRGGMRVSPVVATRPGHATLTDRERELVALVEQGLTNVEIARRMGLGRPTVARILSNAMAKVGAESRAQLTILAGASGRDG